MTIIEVIDAHIKLSEDLLLTIEYISMPQKIADKLSDEVFGLISREDSIATSTIKTYRNIPIRIVDNINLKVCYATSDFFRY